MKTLKAIIGNTIFSVVVCLGFTLLPACSNKNQNKLHQYISLGDSYSAGLGANFYYKNDNCSRSHKAYSEIFAKAHKINKNKDFTFLACSGATLDDIIKKQSHFNKKTDLITLTAGGNDANFSSAIRQCAIFLEKACKNTLNSSYKETASIISDRFIKLMEMIKEKAPNAEIIVLGYPHIFTNTSEKCKDRLLGNSISKRKGINEAADALNNLTKTTIDKNPINLKHIKFVDLVSYFNNHEVCSNDPWIHDSRGQSISEFYHPNEDGQLIYYKALEANL